MGKKMMVEKILNQLKGTNEAEIILQMENAYNKIASEQNKWYEKSSFTCTSGCGECCRNFEPDLLECEVLYMAAWLMENQPEIVNKIAEGNFPFEKNKGCPFWNEHNSYHCTIYGGRSCICRLFGGCGSRSKNGKVMFKPCKFYPTEKLSQFKTPLAHKNYMQEEILNIFGAVPPVMSDLMEEVENLNPQVKRTRLIRDSLPETVRRLKWIISMNAQAQ